jgi:curved DNA-binding protein CbpA
MTKSYYDLLGVAPTAPLDEIKKAFRREIAKYHPDKVQHLGQEFQEIAAVKAAELTQAYKTLCDESLRVEYDAAVAGAAVEAGVRDPGAGARESPRRNAPAPGADASSRPAARPAASPPSRPAEGNAFAAERADASELLRKAAIVRFRQALGAEFGQCDDAPVPGFDIACAPHRGRFWSKVPPRVLARVVAKVDPAAVAETWGLGARAPFDKHAHREVCIFLMGPALAPAAELARAIAEARRKPAAGSKLHLVPLSTRSWAAHIPADAPAAVKSIVERLKGL